MSKYRFTARTAHSKVRRLSLIVAFVLCLPPSIAGADTAEAHLEKADDFWAFKPPVKPRLPQVESETWCQSPIDRFILARLESAGLTPAPPANRRTLIRRATYDLTGLPPTPEEVDAFLADVRAEAFERVVERLLASPRYGEKWGRHWLDIARYADSNGLDENLAYANAFRYRDYVIDAFNMDLPYDEFVREQVAGDLLAGEPESDREHYYRRVTATGFLSLGPKMLACDDGQKMEMDIIDEQVDTVGRAFMGLTLGCARCHDHKFDPISTEDYYRLAGIFKSTKTMENFKVVAEWHEYPLASREEQERAKQIEQEIKSKEQELKSRNRQAKDEFIEVERKRVGAYFLAALRVVDLWRTPEQSKAERKSPAIENVAAESHLNLEILKQWADYLEKLSPESGEFWAPLVAASEGESKDLIALIKDQLEKALKRGNQQEEKDDDTKNTSPYEPDPNPKAARQVLYDSKGPFRFPKDTAKYFSEVASADIERLKVEKTELEESRLVLPRAMGVREGKTQNLKVHLRGNYLTLGKETSRGIPGVFSNENAPLVGEMDSGRLELAEWLTNSEHPLTSRVMANRIWLWHFGEGLVRTADNFGLLGEQPVNRSLLDWLAWRFREFGWSIKQMHRLIMLSSTYQMRSEFTSDAYEKDPENRHLWRFPTRRLTAEELRDTILALGNTLDTSMHGQRLPSRNRDYVTGTSSKEGTYDFTCRSVYLPILRSAVYDVFQAFDFPDPSVLNGRRAATTVAPQALFLMNGGIVLRESRRMAHTLLNEGSEDESRIRSAYLHTFARPPKADEVVNGLGFIREYEAALALEAVEDPEERRLRAWQGFCRVLMAANEFVYLN